MVTTYTLTTYVEDHGFTHTETRTLTILSNRRTILGGKFVDRSRAAVTLNAWRGYARLCPDQELRKAIEGV